MMYLSQLLGAAVEDSRGARAGKIIDVITTMGTGSENLVIVVESDSDERWYVGVDAVVWQGNTARISNMDAVERVPPRSQQISLARDVLDKQVIDLQRKKAVRVNDVCFGDDWRILGVDNSALGLVRRLAPAWLLGARSKRTPVTLIPWERIELIGESPVEEEQRDEDRHHQQSGQLAELRPADIADIMSQLTPGQGARLLEGLDDETAADALEELNTEQQSYILENISAERAADILAEMEPDEAADLVARLPEERARELLGLMTPQESEDVQELLEYEEDTAGGIMTTDFVAIDASKTVSDALEAVRVNIREQNVRLAYVYCIADLAREDYTLLGIVSLWELLVADGAQPLQELMETDLVTVQPDAEPRAVVEIMAKYNFLAVPVVSEAGTLEGVVTIDDALDVLLPGERRKPHRMY
ncbi:MAG TPA: CBS domain-containing protein [Ktedonobacteraceae bacterium]|nr:CBS domain-containing protein [Ktedonobacteraceae bacterium]